MAESDSPRTENTVRLNVGVVGTGRAGAVLGAALKRAGHNIKACTAVSEISRLRADLLLPGVPVTDVNTAVADRDLILLTVPDDVLPELVNGLAATRAVSPGTFVMHAAGRYGASVLEPLTAQGCLPLAIHPVMTFTGTSVDLNRLDGCAFGVTSPDLLRPVAEALVVEMGGDPVWVPEENRLMYHAAIAGGANHLMTLVNQTMDLLRGAGIEDPERLTAPLLGASLDNALRHGDSAVTGPVVRGDAGTVAQHLEIMYSISPVVGDAYRAMARLTAERALEAGTLRADEAVRLLEVLGK